MVNLSPIEYSWHRKYASASINETVIFFSVEPANDLDRICRGPGLALSRRPSMRVPVQYSSLLRLSGESESEGPAYHDHWQSLALAGAPGRPGAHLTPRRPSARQNRSQAWAVGHFEFKLPGHRCDHRHDPQPEAAPSESAARPRRHPGRCGCGRRDAAHGPSESRLRVSCRPGWPSMDVAAARAPAITPAARAAAAGARADGRAPQVRSLAGPSHWPTGTPAVPPYERCPAHAARKEPSCLQVQAGVWAMHRASSPHARDRQREQPT